MIAGRKLRGKSGLHGKTAPVNGRPGKLAKANLRESATENKLPMQMGKGEKVR